MFAHCCFRLFVRLFVRLFACLFVFVCLFVCLLGRSSGRSLCLDYLICCAGLFVYLLFFMLVFCDYCGASVRGLCVCICVFVCNHQIREGENLPGPGRWQLFDGDGSALAARHLHSVDVRGLQSISALHALPTGLGAGGGGALWLMPVIWPATVLGGPFLFMIAQLCCLYSPSFAVSPYTQPLHSS